jgi:hypothetical protein
VGNIAGLRNIATLIQRRPCFLVVAARQIFIALNLEP